KRSPRRSRRSESPGRRGGRPRARARLGAEARHPRGHPVRRPRQPRHRATRHQPRDPRDGHGRARRGRAGAQDRPRRDRPRGAARRGARRPAPASPRPMLADGTFGEAGREVVIEDSLKGEELSVLALTDGERTLILPAAQDHKRLGEGDTGPNTGGMGAYCPVSIAGDALLERVRREVLEPTLRELAARGARYTGVLYAGLMLAADGTPYVLEFNCRFGDPETQA